MKNKTLIYPTILVGLLIVFLFNCKKEAIQELSAVKIAEITNITTTSATARVEITGDVVTARGVCWCTSENPTIADSKSSDGGGGGAFTSSITRLTPGTTYYIRAYAINSKDTIYGNQLSFTSSSMIVAGSKTGLFVYNTSTETITNIINEGGPSFYLFSSDTKKIFYLYGKNLYSINLDGSAKTLILPGIFTSHGYPAWSPDGGKVAYMKNQDIYLINSDGTNDKQFTHFGKGSSGLKWSKDGQKISFYGYDNGVKLYYSTLDGEVHLVSDKAEKADWSYDSQEIAYTLYSNSKFQIYRFNLSGSAETSITEGQNPLWSPLVKKILFISGSGLKLTNPDGTQQTSILVNAGLITAPLWSPDGQHIAFISHYSNVSIIDADGQNYKIITDVKSTDTSSDGCSYPVWSPDGKYILYCRGAFGWTL